MIETTTGFLFQFAYLFSHITLADVVDIVLVAAIFFVAFQALYQTRALQMLRGVIIIAILGVLILLLLPLNTFGYVVRALLLAGLIALPWLFQDELRRALTRLGRIGRRHGYRSTFDRFKETIIATTSQLAARNEGALIVLEGQTSLEEIIQTGIPIQAEELSSELLLMIFNQRSPLHDGAVVLRGDRLVAAGCILPVQTQEVDDSSFGTRHRAALGLSNQVPDALVIVISEETGRISVAFNGRIYRGLSDDRLEAWLERFQDQLTGDGGSRWSWLQGGGTKATIYNLILAVGLAIIAWVGVTYQTNPPQQVFIKDVPIIVTSPEPDLILMSEIPETANIKVQTTRDRLADLSTATIRAEVDLGNLPAGVHRVPVEVSLADERAQVISVVPDFVNVALEPEISVEVTPTVNILDSEALPFGYTLGEISISPETVILDGPESLVEEVVEVRAELTLNGNRTDFQESLLVIPLDENGSWVEDVRIMPAEVLATVPIEHTEFTRQVPIQADLRADTLEDGYEITSVRLSPTSLTLTGPRTALESVGDFILTAPITLTNVYSELTLDVPLILPDGVVGKGEKGETVDNAVVSIFVSPVTNYLLQTVAPATRGLPITYSAEISPQQVSVLLIGPEPILDEIEADPSLVVIYVDVTDVLPGIHVLPLEYEAPSGISIELFPSEVQVTISEEPES